MAPSTTSNRKAASRSKITATPAKTMKPSGRTSKASLKATSPPEASDSEDIPLPASRAKASSKVAQTSNKVPVPRKASTVKKEAQAARAKPSIKAKRQQSKSAEHSDEALEILKLKGELIFV